MTFKKAPDAYQINDLIKQTNYLVNGAPKPRTARASWLSGGDGIDTAVTTTGTC